ncbi:SRF-type transcription factor [Paragonimus heterotremus]|uniref:SRF-type transcription factor n=1 Tax=Paragonimus heterotremus TaxID=100268 RepID=A0A8J4T3H0_9TREM|nr:SRF-type transcription factor [Paragonimus heterotremus]
MKRSNTRLCGQSAPSTGNTFTVITHDASYEPGVNFDSENYRNPPERTPVSHLLSDDSLKRPRFSNLPDAIGQYQLLSTYYGDGNPSEIIPEKLTKGKQKIPIEFIHDRVKRYSTFSKRKTGMMKKAVELAELTGAEVLLLIASETNHVYTFATKRLRGIIDLDSGKELIKTCLSSDNLVDVSEVRAATTNIVEPDSFADLDVSTAPADKSEPPDAAALSSPPADSPLCMDSLIASTESVTGGEMADSSVPRFRLTSPKTTKRFDSNPHGYVPIAPRKSGSTVDCCQTMHLSSDDNCEPTVSLPTTESSIGPAIFTPTASSGESNNLVTPSPLISLLHSNGPQFVLLPQFPTTLTNPPINTQPTLSPFSIPICTSPITLHVSTLNPSSVVLPLLLNSAVKDSTPSVNLKVANTHVPTITVSPLAKTLMPRKSAVLHRKT